MCYEGLDVGPEIILSLDMRDYDRCRLSEQIWFLKKANVFENEDLVSLMNKKIAEIEAGGSGKINLKLQEERYSNSVVVDTAVVDE